MKYADLIGDPKEIEPLDLDCPLPTAYDVLKHMYFIILLKKKCGSRHTLTELFDEVANTLIKLYAHRSLPTMLHVHIVRYYIIFNLNQLFRFYY